MCGIAGVFNFKSRKPVDEARLGTAAALMAHRGPDDAGTWCDGPVGLAHQRLSIIDLSSAGHQPMHGEDGMVIAFNGEIYNYVELREQLQDRYHFRTGTDTEVILAAFKVYGRRCVEHFIGMFAFAIYARGELYVFRDRLGIKPLYYTETSDGLMFASEAKTLLALQDTPADVAQEAIPSFLLTGYVTGEQTMFSNIRKLLPGHFLHVADGRLRSERYWQLVYSDSGLDESTALEQFNELFNSAITLRLRSDVPVGVFLSGGLDSSAVVGRLSTLLGKTIKTFSVRYDQQGFDETRYAREVATHYHTDHHEITMNADMFMGYLDDYIWHMDEPVTEAAAVSLYYVSKLAREHVTVVLSGEGADEILAGYEMYFYQQVLEKVSALPHALLGLGAGMSRLVGTRKLEKYFMLAQLPLAQRYQGVSMYSPETLTVGGEPLFGERLQAELRGDNPFSGQIAQHYADTADSALLNRQLGLDTNTWLPDDILVKADKMSMATSIELRVPFLDHRLVEFCAALPVQHKLRGRTGKYLLRKAIANEVPRSIIERKKMGFPTPLENLFRGELFGYASDVLLDQTTRERGIYSPAALQKLLAEHRSGSDHHKRIWQALVIELWHRRFIDRPVRQAA